MEKCIQKKELYFVAEKKITKYASLNVIKLKTSSALQKLNKNKELFRTTES